MSARPLFWHHIAGRPPSPFVAGIERPLAVTLFETPEATVTEREILRAIRKLSARPALKVIEGALTGQNSDLPSLTVEEVPERDMVVSRLAGPDGVGGSYCGQLIDMQRLADSSGIERTHLYMAAAHSSWKGELLITSSDVLLSNRDRVALRRFNAVSASEGAKIVGLLLRSRADYSLPGVTVDQSGFYHEATASRLPDIGNWWAACVYSASSRGDNIVELGQSVFRRAVRIIRARDQIAIQYYQPQHNGTVDVTMYHFDYLTLLASGTFDVLARVAKRAYGLAGSERYLRLAKPEFVKSLRKAGATQLCDLVTSDRFLALDKLINTLRNTIHEAALTVARGSEDGSALFVAGKDADTVRCACDSIGPSRQVWGFGGSEHRGALSIEPYRFTLALIDVFFAYVNDVARVTDADGLFPAGTAIRNSQSSHRGRGDWVDELVRSGVATFG